MIVATRWVLILVLTCLGVFATQAEVDAGRFCRRASTCPCVEVASCVPHDCVSVRVATCEPTAYPQLVPHIRPLTTITGPTISGKIYDGGGPPALLRATNMSIVVKAVCADSGGVEIVISNNVPVNTGTAGTYSISSYTDTPLDLYYVEYSRVGGAATVREGPYHWSGGNQIIYPSVPG